ncbi:MAG: outer membrane protein assembly factor BamB family protein [Treponema sp.]
MKKYMITLLLFSILWYGFALPDQPEWTAVAAGELLCDPIAHERYVYTLTSDHALNCINSAGSFIWRRPIKRSYKPFLTAGASGVLIVADESGTIQAVSSQGLELWSFRLPEAPVYAPVFSKDGRLLILTKKALVCFSMKGTLKWRVLLPSPPVRPLSETGNAAVMLLLQNKESWMVSLTGIILDRQRIKKQFTILHSAGMGYIAAATDGTLAYYSNPPEQTVQWELQGTLSPVFIEDTDTTILCGYAGGKIALLNLSDGATIWNATFNAPLQLPVICEKKGLEYHIACRGFAAIITHDGKIRWETTVPAKLFLPLITEEGSVISIDEWVLTSYRMETKIHTNRPQQTSFTAASRIIETERKKSSLPFFLPYDESGGSADVLLRKIEDSILTGTIGGKEAVYALYLETILLNDQRSAYIAYDFTIHQRALAAVLLGKLESLEYRTILLYEAQKTREAELAAALITGLGLIAADPDGQSIYAIKLLLKQCGAGEIAPVYAACDALLEISKYGTVQSTEDALKMLFFISSGAFPENVKAYARQKIKTIVK